LLAGHPQLPSRRIYYQKASNNRKIFVASAVSQDKLNSVALVRKAAVPTERPQLVGEVSANFCGCRVSHAQRNGSQRPLVSVF
jgi:hypothetical protein